MVSTICRVKIIDSSQNCQNNLLSLIWTGWTKDKQVRSQFQLKNHADLCPIIRTSSKATTNWPRSALATHMPKALHQSLKNSRYYVSSSDSISIQCDSHRGQTENEEENYRRLHDEISQIYKRSVPGVTTQEKKQKHEAL